MPGSGVGTLTGIGGPAVTVTSLGITGITSILIEPVRGVLTIKYGNNQKIELDYVLTTTLTDIISSLISTIVASGT
jgi:hypothetical protein